MNKEQGRVISRIWRITMVIVLSSLIFGVAGATPEYVEDRVFIGIDSDKISITDIVDESMVISDYCDLIPGAYLIHIPEGMTVPEAIAYFSSIEYVKFVEPDYYSHISEGETASSSSPVVGILAGFGFLILVAKKRKL